MRLVPKEELRSRITKLQQRLQADDIGAALIIQNTDLYYFAGIIQQAWLFVPAEGEPALLVRKSFERARTGCALDQVIPLDSPKDMPNVLKDLGIGRLDRLGLELDVLPVKHYRRYREMFQPAELVDISLHILSLRQVKTAYEVQIIREAARLADFMQATARASLRVGMTEVELVGLIEGAARGRGHQGFIKMRNFNQETFYGHLLSGPEAVVPSYMESPTGGLGLSPAVPQGAGWRVIKPNEPVMVDLVGGYDGYLADQTRTIVAGRLPSLLEKAYETARVIEAGLAERARPGVICRELYDWAVAEADRLGLGDYFMGYPPNRVSFIGHGLGLELDEPPAVAKGAAIPLESGMILAFEPKFMFPEYGVVGVEDTYLITAQGGQPITGAAY